MKDFENSSFILSIDDISRLSTIVIVCHVNNKVKLIHYNFTLTVFVLFVFRIHF